MEPSLLRYDRTGRGSPLVLLHGISHRRQVWRPVLRHLGEHVDVVAPDLPGCGESPEPPPGEPYDVAALADAVAELCQDLGVVRPHVVGNSLGGAVALELGIRGRAASVTAFSPIGFATPLENATLRALVYGMAVAGRVPERLRGAVADTPPLRALARRTLHADPQAPAAREARFNTAVLEPGSPFQRLAPEVANYTVPTTDVPCPVTIAWGERDRILPPRMARRARDRIPHAQVVTLLDCGHIPMVDDPATVAVTIRRACRPAGEGLACETSAVRSSHRS
ncbi:alpha/beta fold hydrolase [Lipingzhangella sp. LS1_29]|uniref:Alpha/beta fold hydrolase n=1 Tax=Lipingzhangella rawalii TaxID=2055835 RepID=A0ABU2H886_9ACTN|nr:alpha/beta fold hydrolase [Lipingzhangella rawalii]MDS1271506.1 alpha/beta fold hydrolase [Lipingzhangella rawalii]